MSLKAKEAEGKVSDRPNSGSKNEDSKLLLGTSTSSSLSEYKKAPSTPSPEAFDIKNEEDRKKDASVAVVPLSTSSSTSVLSS